MNNIEVKGYEQAKKIMDQLDNSMQKKILLRTLKTSSRTMLRSAKEYAPKKTGALRKMLKVVRYRDKSAPKTEIDVAIKHVFSKTKKGKINQYYGRMIHEGTVDPRINKSKKGGKKVMVFMNGGETIFTYKTKGLKANPYVEKAYNTNVNNTIRDFGDNLAAEVNKFVDKNFKSI